MEGRPAGQLVSAVAAASLGRAETRRARESAGELAPKAQPEHLHPSPALEPSLTWSPRWQGTYVDPAGKVVYEGEWQDKEHGFGKVRLRGRVRVTVRVRVRVRVRLPLTLTLT